MVTPTNDVIARAEFTLRWAPGTLGIFETSSCLILIKTKKSLIIWAWEPWHCAIWWTRPWFLHYVHKKVRWGPEVATFRTKTLNFSRVLHLNWLAKSHWGPGPLVAHIIFNYCYTQKIIKETEARLCHIAMIGGISSEGRGRAFHCLHLWVQHLCLQKSCCYITVDFFVFGTLAWLFSTTC